MIKKILVLTMFTLFVSLCLCFSVSASDDISLVVDNKKIVTDVPPVIIDGRTMVPIRGVFENLNARVSWNNSLRQVVVNNGKTVMIFNIDSKLMRLNDSPVMMDVAPFITDGRAMVPLRFISEKLGHKVKWEPSERAVYITTVKEQTSSVSTTKPDSNQSVNQNQNNQSSNEEIVGINLSSLKLTYNDEYYMITVYLASKVKPKITTLTEPDRLIFDFYDVIQFCDDGKISAKSDPVVEMRWAEHPEYTRLVVETSEKTTYSISYISGKNCRITIPRKPSSDNTDSDKNNSSQETNNNTSDNTSQGTESSTTTTKPAGSVSVSDITTVVIDAGHGGYDPGAVGRDGEGNVILNEKDVCLDIAQQIEAMLLAENINVIMTRSTDTALGDTEMDDLVKRCEIANASGACLFVSIHNNAFINPEANGTCVLYAGLATANDYGITGKEVARKIQNRMLSATGLYDRGIVESPGIVVLKKTAMPAVLVECAFITNPSDREQLGSKSGRTVMATAIYNGIIDSLVQMGRLK